MTLINNVSPLTTQSALQILFQLSNRGGQILYSFRAEGSEKSNNVSVLLEVRYKANKDQEQYPRVMACRPVV